jgi:hypothetical protein
MPDVTYKTTLRAFIVKHFDREELRTLCYDLGVDFDSLGGEGKAAKARELVAYMVRHSRLEELVAAVSQRRKTAWETQGLDELLAQPSGSTPGTTGQIQSGTQIEHAERERSTGATDEAQESRATLASASPLISGLIGFLVGVLGNLIAAWIQQDLLANAFTLPRIALIVFLAAVGLGAGVWIQRHPPLERKQWVGLAVALMAVMIFVVIIFGLTKEDSANHPPSIQSLVASPSTLRVGQQATLTVLARDEDEDSLAYYWEAQRGTVPPGAQGATVLYIAPTSSGLDRVKVTVTDGQASTSRDIRLSVLAEDGGGQ